MEKKYVVHLTDAERETLWSIVKKLSGSSQKVRRAQVLLKADADGPNWTDKKIAEAFSCRTKTVENIRQRLVTRGFDIALNGKKRECHFPQTFPTYFHSLSPPPRADLTFSTKLQDVHHDSSFFF